MNTPHRAPYSGANPRSCTAVLAAMAIAFPAAVSAATLTADASHANNATYAIGEAVGLTFSVSGASTSAKLVLDVKNERDSLITHVEYAVPSSGSGTIPVTAPNQRLGFYRVYAQLSTGETVATLGSRQAGYLTYCIVPDPAQRALYGEKETFFGMQGGFSDAMNIFPYLGIRWVMGGLNWRDEEPDHSGQFSGNVGQDNGGSYKGVPWKLYTMPSLIKSIPDWAVIPGTQGSFLGALDPSQDSACARYVRAAASAYGAAYPDRIEHVFQITWEPSYSWAYKGTSAQLAHIYEVAVGALRKSDPKALCIGPTLFPDDYLTQEVADFLDSGGGKYIDGFSMHPYAVRKQDTTLVNWLRIQKALVFASAGKTIPCFGTEQGWATGDTVANEIAQARGLIRQHLIMMGEGFRFNIGFYIADFDLEPGYGYYYNLNSNIQFGTDKIGPKPIAPAYAALSYLLEGHHATQCLNNNAANVMGYVYERAGSKFTVLWTPGAGSPTYDLSTGMDSVTVYDWMGNATRVACPNQTLRLVLKQEPVYVQTAGGAAPSYPDLVVTAITWKPANPAAGDSVTFSATVKNQGTAATRSGDTIGVSFSVDGAQVAWCDTSKSALAAGASRTLTVNGGPGGRKLWPAAAGKHAVLAQVDDVSRIVESDETNNTRTDSLTVGQTGVGADRTDPRMFVNAISARSTGRAISLTYSVASRARVTIAIHDLRGACLVCVVDRACEPGAYRSDYSRGVLPPSGRYIVRMDAGRARIERAVLLVR